MSALEAAGCQLSFLCSNTEGWEGTELVGSFRNLLQTIYSSGSCWGSQSIQAPTGFFSEVIWPAKAWVMCWESLLPRKLLEQAGSYWSKHLLTSTMQCRAVPTPAKAPVRPLCTVPVKKCWVWSCLLWDTGCLTTVYSKHTQKRKKFTSGRWRCCIFQMPLFFFFSWWLLSCPFITIFLGFVYFTEFAYL